MSDEKMQYEATFYIALRWRNKWMEQFDLREEGKWYVDGMLPVRFSTDTKITPDYFKKIIEESRKAYDKGEEDKWMPAIEFCGTLYVADGVKQISDGKKGIFVG